MDVRIEYHSPDQCHAAVFLRDGQPWYLNGALVGMNSTPAQAVQDLIELASYLVEHGENFLTTSDWPLGIPLEDRLWLYSQIDHALPFEEQDRLYAAMREAERNRDPLQGKIRRLRKEDEN